MVNRKSLLVPWALACLVIAGMVAPLASARPSNAVGTGSGAPEQWAYGTETWSNTTSYTSTYSYTSSWFYATEVVTTATNTSSSTVEVQGAWTWAYTYVDLYCVPNCSAPSTMYNLTLSEWGNEYTFANTTSMATVYENGTPTAAFGLSNVSYLGASNYSEQYVDLDNGSTVYRGVAFDGANSSYSISFAPALGLIPWSPSPQRPWNASAATWSGAIDQSSYLYSYEGYGEHSLSRGNAYSEYSLPSNESLMGQDIGNSTLANGQNGTGILLAYQGPYDVAYGLFYAPQSSELFGGATQNWSVGVIYGTLTQTPKLLIGELGTPGEYRVIGGTTTWSTSIRAVGVNRLSVNPPGPLGVSPTPSGSSVAQPEPVRYAQAVARCLLTSCSGPAAPSPPVSGLSFPDWAIAIAAGAGAGLIVVGVRLRPRRPRSSGTFSVSKA